MKENVKNKLNKFFQYVKANKKPVINAIKNRPLYEEDFYVTKRFANRFEAIAKEINAHGFCSFCDRKQENYSIYELAKKVEQTLKYNDDSYEPDKIKKDVELAKKLVLDFYSQYLPHKANEVEQIFTNNHPLFKDENNKSHVKMKKTYFFQKSDNYVKHSDNNNFLNFYSSFDGDIDDWISLAHECAHAISSSMQRYVKPLKKSNQDVLFDRDALAEIESLIVERLFAHHLLEIGKIKQEDYDYLNREQEDSLIYEANVIKEEQNVIRQLPMPITFESLDSLVEKLKQKEKTTRLISRIKKMNKSPYKRSRYYFRYFVGRIVSYEWFDRFQASTSEQQKEMLEKFEQYLDKNVNYGLNSACEFLLGQNFEKAVLSFIEKRKKSSANTNPILERIEEEKRRILTDDEDEDEFENRAAKK